jgi:hypothetical protein
LDKIPAKLFAHHSSRALTGAMHRGDPAHAKVPQIDYNALVGLRNIIFQRTFYNLKA